MTIKKGDAHPVVGEVRQWLRLLGALDETLFDAGLQQSLRTFGEEVLDKEVDVIDQNVVDDLKKESFAFLTENFLRLPVEDLLQPPGKQPDYTQPGSFGTFAKADWAKFIINGVDMGWYVQGKPLTKKDCGKDVFISVCVGDDVKGCAGLNYAKWCKPAKASGTGFARTLCPSDCPNPIITDQAGKWGCGANPASATGFRAFCHHQVKLVCFST